jgi:anti-sigma factor RsiW
MKNLIYLFAAVIMFAFTACGGGEAPAEASEEAVVEEAVVEEAVVEEAVVEEDTTAEEVTEEVAE